MDEQEWIQKALLEYDKYMKENHPDLYYKFQNNLDVPQFIWDKVTYSKGLLNTVEDYNEITRITDEFFERYNTSHGNTSMQL